MTEVEFQRQISRLMDTFGANHYKPERVKLIWREVSQLSPYAFAKVIDRSILECRQAPLMQDMREEIARQREMAWSNEKKTYQAESKAFFEGSNYSDDDRKMFLSVIVKRINRKLPDEEWASFLKLLDQSAGRQKQL